MERVIHGEEAKYKWESERISGHMADGTYVINK